MNSSRNQTTDEIEQDDEDESKESIDSVESTSPVQTYQMRPKLNERFQPKKAKEIIHNVMFDTLSSKVYSAEEAEKWVKQITDLVRIKIGSEVNKHKNYKFAVNTVLMENSGSGAKIGNRCVWDAETDTMAYDTFMNDTIICCTAVYAVFMYE